VRFIVLISIILLCQTAWAAGDINPFPQVASAYLVEIDGIVVWEKQAHQRLPIASLTKLMTALLVLEQERLQDIVSISAAATHETGSRLNLKANEHFQVRDLLAAALIHSANDACHALAEHLAGSETAFVKLMNQRAQTLGLHDTHFQNACGHDAPKHDSSARDLAKLAHEALKYPQVIPLTSQAHASIANQAGEKYRFINKNMMIGKYNGALGLKSGYTAKAGKCLVVYAKRDGHEVLLVMLHGNDRWWDAADILDIAFAHARTTP
jgi:D-alanyl-D-alanine carboxypeptidase (penicillin-binding protein 5/6)